MSKFISNDIKRILQEKPEVSIKKKQITLNFEEEIIAKLDNISKRFERINKTKNFSRSYLIELAVNSFIEESYSVLEEIEENKGLTDYENDKSDDDYDLVILDANEKFEEGFVDTFLGDNMWFPCRIRDERIPKLKYIAIYRGKPVSGITHYAKIKEIKFNVENGSKTAYFEGKAIELKNKITLGNKQGYQFRCAKYVKLENLLKAKTADDLF